MGAVTGYHAHVYYDGADRARAADLRTEIGRRFPVLIGRMHDQAVGPHTKAMFQVVFGHDVFGELVPWLMRHRNGLSVLVHAETGDDVADHTRHVLWVGDPVALSVDALRPGLAR
ncbi:MAG: DOPA 4,5-dioxygenase family protein [Pseudomonadales bacterium]